jgi:hypothetical protein
MGHPEDEDQDLFISDLVQNPEIPHPYAPDIVRSPEFDAAGWTGVFSQRIDSGH